MKTHFTRLLKFGVAVIPALLVTVSASLPVPLAAQGTEPEPRIGNAALEHRAAGGNLEREFRAVVAAQAGPFWTGYLFPLLPGHRQSCCWSDNQMGCRLEPQTTGRGTVVNAPASNTVRLEGDTHFLLLFRVEQRVVGKIRTFSQECGVDAGGLRVVLFAGVRPEESVGLLSGYTSASEETRESRRIADGAVSAIALHNSPAADQALERFVAASQPEALRSRTAFWLGNARGRRGLDILKRMAAGDPSDAVRDKVSFALSQSKEPEALDALVGMAKNDRSTKVRGQAIFWLAQQAGKKAVGAITEAIENDPETRVKEQAVFALSQLPKDEGIPKLIEVARSNRNAAVRKKAFFWLGQSKDPRAVSFFQEALK